MEKATPKSVEPTTQENNVEQITIEKPQKPRSIIVRLIVFILRSILLMFILLVAITLTGPNAFVVSLTLGWLMYIIEVSPQIQPNMELILQTLICFVFATIALHYICSWIYQHKVEKAWKKSWSAAIVTLILLFFAVGTAATGIIKQSSWLAEEETKYVSSFMLYETRRALESTSQDMYYYPTSYKKLRLYFFMNVYNGEYLYDHLCLNLPSYDLFAIIRFSIPNNLLQQSNLVTVYLVKNGQNQKLTYDTLSVKEIVHNLEQGIIPEEKE